MVHGNVGQSDLTREDMTRYIRYLCGVVGESKNQSLNQYICLNGQCGILSNWIGILAESFGESYELWDLHTHLTLSGTELKEPYKYAADDFTHRLVEWDGLYWDALGGGTRRQKEEYYETQSDFNEHTLHRFDLLPDQLKLNLVKDDFGYNWRWYGGGSFYSVMGSGFKVPRTDKYVDQNEIIQYEAVDERWHKTFRDFINHLRSDEFSVEEVGRVGFGFLDKKIYNEVQRLQFREDMIRYEWGYASSGIYHSSVYDNGELVGTIGLKSFDREELNPQCYDDFEWVLREIEWESNGSIQDGQIDKWVVFDVGLDEPYRNKGIGYKMYENIFKIKNNNPHTIIVGYGCATYGTTSYDAERVYKRLQRKYIGKGLVVSSIKKNSDEFSADNIYIGDEYGGFVKSNPDAVNLPGVIEFPGEQERIESFMPLEDYENLPYDDVNLVLSKLPYPTEGFTEEEIEQQHESIISTIVSHEYIHQSIDEEILAWANENKLEKGDYYAAHEIMAYVDMAHRESNNMRGFKARLFQLVGSHPIITDNPELADRILDAMTRSRKGLKFQVPAEIKTIMQAFELAGFEILVVGGAVRDAVMGLTPKDYDLATNALPNEVNEVIAQIADYRVVSTPEAQLARGVLTSLVLPPSGEVIEITTFRAELGYEEGTRRPIAVPAETFKEDSERRDFTMNALGWKLNGTILDYHDGLDDLEFGDLVSVGDANDRIKEDPLRILRAIRFHSRYGLDLDEDLSEAIGTHLKLLLTLSAERVRKELDSILKSEEGIYDLVNVGIVETLIPEYQGGYWGERNYDDGDSKFSFIADIQRYSMVDQPYPSQFNYTPRPWQPSIAYALLFKNVVTKEEFNEQYRRGPISFSRTEADMIAELIALYPVAVESEEPRDIVAIVTSPHYDELMLMLEYTNRLDLVDYFKPYRTRYKGKPPKGYAMTVADEYGIEPGPALGERLSEITEAIILGDIEDWDEGLNYYAAEEEQEVPEFVYHATPGKNLESIMEHGLEPRIGQLSIHAFGKEIYDEKVGGPKVWATTNNKARIYAALIAPMSYLEDNAILRIKTEGLDFKYYGFEEFFTDKHVPPSHIEHMYFIMGEKSEEDPNWTVDQQIDYLHNKRGACPYIVDGERRCFDGRLCTYTEHASEEVGTRERIAYAGVILDEDTSEQLLAHFETLIPESWTRYAHHMTVSLGKSIPNQADLGKEVTLTVTAVGKSDDAIAVAVSGYPSRNAIPHITLAVPLGGKPFNSNKITDWHSVEPFEIQGLLRDVKTYVAETFRGEAGPSYLFGSYHYDHSLQDLYEQFEMYYGPDNKYGLIDASPGYEAGPAGGSGLWAIIDAFGDGVLREVPVPKRDWITNFFGEITIPEMSYILRNWDDLAFNFGLDEELSYELVDRYVDDFNEYSWPKNGLKGLLWTREFHDSDKVTLEEYTSGIRRIELLERPVQSLNYPPKSTIFMAENNPGRLDIFYDWVEVDKKEIFNRFYIGGGFENANYNDRYDIANVVIAYKGTIKEKFLGDLPSVVYFYIRKDIFDETDPQSWFQLHSLNSGWECRCFDCLQEGGPLFIYRQSGIYEKENVSELISESVRQGVPYQSWFQDSRVSKLVRTLSIPITGMNVTKPQFKHLLTYLEFDFEIEGKETRWTDIELGSTYFSSKTNQSLRNLEERLVKNRMVTLNYPRIAWRKY